MRPRGAASSRLRWIAAASIVAGSLAAAGGATAAIELVDDAGHRLSLQTPARRIVALAPHLTELLFEAGAGDRIVGAAAYSDYPEAAKAIARIGDGRGLDLERIVALHPDLVVAWESGNSRRSVQRLRQMGFAVFSNEPRSLDDIASTLERLGRLAGTSDRTHASAERFRRRLAELRQGNRQVAPVRVFYQVWGRPLLTVSANHVIADVLRSCQAENVFARHRLRLPHPSREAVMLADPDAIIAADASGGQAALAQWQRWPRLRAVALGNLFTVDPTLLHRHTPRILEGVAQVCAQVRQVRRD